MRDLERHLGVSYPTTRQRFADLLVRLGFEQPAGPGAEARVAADTDAVLADLAAGRIGVSEAEALLSDLAPTD
jgi:hypothetical protein